MENIKFKDLDLVGKELFRKVNETFYISKLSKVMERIFLASNHDLGISEIKDECYMKSGILPNYIYYIHTSQLPKTKNLDIVYFNGKKSIWFYIPNMIENIGEDPYQYILKIYNTLLKLTKREYDTNNNFYSDEFNIIEYVLCIRLAYFLYETYGSIVIDIDRYKESLETSLYKYTTESIDNFIDHIKDNCDNPDYFDKKIYLESYILLEFKQ